MAVEFMMQNKQHGFIGLKIRNIFHTFGAIHVTDSKEDKIAAQGVKDLYFGWLVTKTFFFPSLPISIMLYV